MFKKNGRDYILQTSYPYTVGQLGPEAMIDMWTAVQVAGYEIYIAFQGTFMGDNFPFSPNMETQMNKELNAMASWYLIEVIAKDLERFSCFAL